MEGQRIKEKQDKLRDRPDLTVATWKQKLRLIDGEIKRAAEDCLGDIDTQISQVMARINNVPGAEVTLGALDREYQTKKAAIRCAADATTENWLQGGRSQSNNKAKAFR